MALRHLRAFVAIVEFGGYACRSAHLNLSHPELSWLEMTDLAHQRLVRLPVTSRFDVGSRRCQIIHMRPPILFESAEFIELARDLAAGIAVIPFLTPIGIQLAQDLRQGMNGWVKP